MTLKEGLYRFQNEHYLRKKSHYDTDVVNDAMCMS